MAIQLGPVPNFAAFAPAPGNNLTDLEKLQIQDAIRQREMQQRMQFGLYENMQQAGLQGALRQQDRAQAFEVQQRLQAQEAAARQQMQDVEFQQQLEMLAQKEQAQRDQFKWELDTTQKRDLAEASRNIAEIDKELAALDAADPMGQNPATTKQKQELTDSKMLLERQRRGIVSSPMPVPKPPQFNPDEYAQQNFRWQWTDPQTGQPQAGQGMPPQGYRGKLFVGLDRNGVAKFEEWGMEKDPQQEAEVKARLEEQKRFIELQTGRAKIATQLMGMTRDVTSTDELGEKATTKVPMYSPEQAWQMANQALPDNLFSMPGQPGSPSPTQPPQGQPMQGQPFSPDLQFQGQPQPQGGMSVPPEQMPPEAPQQGQQPFEPFGIQERSQQVQQQAESQANLPAIVRNLGQKSPILNRLAEDLEIVAQAEATTTPENELKDPKVEKRAAPRRERVKRFRETINNPLPMPTTNNRHDFQNGNVYRGMHKGKPVLAVYYNGRFVTLEQ